MNLVPSSSPTQCKAAGDPNAVGGMTLIGNIAGVSQAKYVSNVTLSSHADGSPVSLKKSSTIGRLNLEQTKLYGITTSDKIHATVMPVISSRPKSSTASSVTLTMTGPPSKVSLTTLGVAQTTNECIPLSTAHLHGSRMSVKGNVLSTDSSNESAVTTHKSVNVPVVMATLRIGNPSSSSSGLSVQATSNVTLNTGATSSATFATSNLTSGGASNASGMVYITQATRSQSSKNASMGEIQVPGNLPLALSTVNSTTLVPSQYKHTQHGVLLGHQTSLNLALTPATPQKHATLSQLSIPNSSGHTPTILIATPASGTLASSLPPSCNTGTDVGVTGTTTLNLNQGKTVSINVARVQTSSSGMGQIFTLQQHPDSIGTLTLSGSQQQATHHSGSTWVPSGSGPNILKLGPPGAQTGIQIHPVTAGFKVGSSNKPLTVIAKRPRGQQSSVNSARTINITNSKQLGGNHSKIQTMPPHITLLPDNRTALSSKSLISITPKSNQAVLLSSKNMPLEPSFPGSSEANLTGSAALGTQPDNTVSETPGLNSSGKNGQPMEVT